MSIFNFFPAAKQFFTPIWLWRGDFNGDFSSGILGEKFGKECAIKISLMCAFDD